ncbi:MAG TPA: hypothetical protein VH478_18650 [Trebonia sp.]|nr:hypothetical protein [Trebonia sp.]
MRTKPEWEGGCDDLVESADPAHFTRRPLLRAAVLSQRDGAGQRDMTRLHEAAYESLLRPRPVAQRTVVAGTISDVSPHVLILQTPEGEERLTMTPATATWRGGPVAPTGLRHGDHVIARKTAPGPPAARGAGARRTIVERAWAGIGRATGTILEAAPRAAGSPRDLELLVDEGPAKPRKIVLIAHAVYRQILVRFPRLEAGYLIDVIGLRDEGFLRAISPATSQPAYRASQPPAPPLVSGRVPNPVSGSAVWHDPGEEPATLLGLAYPAIDPETGCEHAARRPPRGRPPARAGQPHAVDPHDSGLGCVRLPYLSVGSVLTVRNDCAGLSVPLPVTSCGAAARLFCDRCLQCSTSPRGRIADLTMAAFVELGGRLEDGCFNASLTVPG